MSSSRATWSRRGHDHTPPKLRKQRQCVDEPLTRVSLLSQHSFNIHTLSTTFSLCSCTHSPAAVSSSLLSLSHSPFHNASPALDAQHHFPSQLKAPSATTTTTTSNTSNTSNTHPHLVEETLLRVPSCPTPFLHCPSHLLFLNCLFSSGHIFPPPPPLARGGDRNGRLTPHRAREHASHCLSRAHSSSDREARALHPEQTRFSRKARGFLFSFSSFLILSLSLCLTPCLSLFHVSTTRLARATRFIPPLSLSLTHTDTHVREKKYATYHYVTSRVSFASFSRPHVTLVHVSQRNTDVLSLSKVK